jgi:hypothetical protein
MLTRTVFPTKPPSVVYALWDLGRSFTEPLEMLFARAGRRAGNKRAFAKRALTMIELPRDAACPSEKAGKLRIAGDKALPLVEQSKDQFDHRDRQGHDGE